MQQRELHPRAVMPLLRALKRANPTIQVVASSATVGRPLRRELATALGLDDFKDGPAIVRAALDDDITSDDLAHQRAVAIPTTITHLYAPIYEEDIEVKIKALVAAVKAVAPVRPLVFIPAQESVNFVVMRLRGNGLVGAVPLHEALGFISQVDNASSKNADIDNSNSNADSSSSSSSAAVVKSGFMHVTQALAAHDALSSRFDDASKSVPVLVANADSARGLHFEGVDCVFLLGRPKSPDEYVHLAGRTGRQGKTGTVVSVVTYKEVKAMQAWESQLKIQLQELPLREAIAV
jgi:Helicase conserved C-terminal domain